MPQIQYNQLKVGDILCKESAGNTMHNVISLGQYLGSHAGGHSDIVHPALVVDQPTISESIGSGLRNRDLDINNLDTWQVFRYINRLDICELAADVASNLAVRSANDPGFGEYGHAKAAKSAFRTAKLGPNNQTRTTQIDARTTTFLDDMENNVPKTRVFFCSNYVVLCFSIASEALCNNPHYAIGLDFERTSPAELFKFLSRNVWWDHKGFVVG